MTALPRQKMITLGRRPTAGPFMPFPPAPLPQHEPARGYRESAVTGQQISVCVGSEPSIER